MGDTRQEILDAALELFAEHGYDKTSLRQIAEQVGVTKAALYYHFPSKEQILVALLEPVGVLQDELLAQLRDDRWTDPAMWTATMEAVIDTILDNREILNLFERNSAAVTALAHEGAWAESHLELHRRTTEFFADERVPLAARVRLACALGAVMGVVEVAGSLVFGSTPAADLRPIVSSVVQGIISPGSPRDLS
jgi:AcrR family transcriptional regulator